MAMIASLQKGRRRELCVVKWVPLRENDFLSRQAPTFLFFLLAGAWSRHCNPLAGMCEAQIAANNYNLRNETWSHPATNTNDIKRTTSLWVARQQSLCQRICLHAHLPLLLLQFVTRIRGDETLPFWKITNHNATKPHGEEKAKKQGL